MCVIQRVEDRWQVTSLWCVRVSPERPSCRDAAATEPEVKTRVWFNYWDCCLVTKTNETNGNISVNKRDKAKRLNGPECIADWTDWAFTISAALNVLNATYSPIFWKGCWNTNTNSWLWTSALPSDSWDSFSFRQNDGTCFEKKH